MDPRDLWGRIRRGGCVLYSASWVRARDPGVTSALSVGPRAASVNPGFRVTTPLFWRVLTNPLVGSEARRLGRPPWSAPMSSACRWVTVCCAPMVSLWADPWTPQYGMGFDVGVEEQPLPRVDATVENDDWSVPRSVSALPPCPVWFVDGVRRVELRVLGADGPRRVPGLFGSYAVGGVRAELRAGFGDHRVFRSVILAGGVMPPAVHVVVGSNHLAFAPDTDPGGDPDRPLWKLQQLMREAEGALAARVAAEEGCVVLVDGPLTFRDPTVAPVVGVIKRFSRQYLDPERDALLGRLGAGERTPLFALGDEAQPVRRYTWYARVAVLPGPWHDRAGIARCEVWAGVGLDAAVGLADRVTSLLPAFAGRASDPRTPQNLVPVAALETWLRHRMGDHGIVRRALLAELATDAMAVAGAGKE